MELFKILGKIAVDNSDANKGIDETTEKAEQSEGKIASAFRKIGEAVVNGFKKKPIDDTKKSLEDITKTIDNQENVLTDLKKKYSDLYLTQGQNSKEAKACAKEIDALSKELLGNKSKLSEATNSAKKFDKSLTGAADSAGNAEGKMSGAFKKIAGAAAAAFTVDKIVDFGKKIVDASATVSAEQSAFAQIMGNFSDEATKKMQSVADTTGMVSTRLTPYMTSMTAKFKGLGYDVDDATTLAQDGLNLAADASAFWDKSLDDSMGSLNSFINGSYEGGEAIGLFANDSQLASYAVKNGVVDEASAWANLDEAKKQATRLKYAEDMMKASGATGQAAKESNQYANVQANLNEKWRQFKAQIGEPLLQNVVLPAMSKLSDIVTKLSPAFENLSKWVSENKNTLAGLGIIVGTMTTLLTAYNIATKVMTLSSKLHTAATIAEKLAVLGLNATLLTSPITWVIVGIAALVAAFVVLWNNVDGFKKFWIDAWKLIAGTFLFIINGIKDGAKKGIDGILGFFKKIIAFVKTNWQGILLFLVNPFAGAFKLIYDNNAKFRTKINEFTKGVKDTISKTFGKVKDAMTKPFTTAHDTIKGVIDKIKGLLKFTWSFPKLKLPHFKVAGKFSLSPPTVPTLGVDWYANGGIMTQPTMFDYNPATGRAKVGGEAGDEAVAPISTLLGYIKTAVSEETAGTTTAIERLINMLATYMPLLVDGMARQIVLDNGTLVGELAPAMDKALGDIYSARERGR